METPIDVPAEKLIQTLKSLREAQNITPEQLGTMIGYQGVGARDNILRLEEGNRNLGINTLEQIAKALGFKVTYVFEKQR